MEQPIEHKYTGNLPGQESGVEYASNWGFPGNVQKPTSLDPYSTQARKWIQKLQGKGWQTQNTEYLHPVLVKFMAKLLRKYSILYLEKVLVAGNKTMKYFPKFGGDLHGKRDMCMHHILEKWKNPNCLFYHAQAKELDAQYTANLCTLIAPGMDYMCIHGSADI